MPEPSYDALLKYLEAQGPALRFRLLSDVPTPLQIANNATLDVVYRRDSSHRKLVKAPDDLDKSGPIGSRWGVALQLAIADAKRDGFVLRAVDCETADRHIVAYARDQAKEQERMEAYRHQTYDPQNPEVVLPVWDTVRPMLVLRVHALSPRHWKHFDSLPEENKTHAGLVELARGWRIADRHNNDAVENTL